VGTHRLFGLWAAACLAFGSVWVSAQAPQSPPAGSSQAPAGPATGFVSGQVVDQSSGSGIAGVTVEFIGGGGRAGGPRQRPVITDAQGRFYFATIAAGSYGIFASKPGYAAPFDFIRTTIVGDGERITDAKVSLVKLGAISGTLRDDAGEPMAGVTVLGLRRSLINGRSTMSTPSRALSDDRGVYRMAGLRPGDYVICACSRDALPFDGTLLTTLASEPMQLMGIASRALKIGADAVSLDDTLRTFAPTLYPNSATVARADRVTVKPGDERVAVDITLTSTRAAHVSGTVIGSASPISASSIQLVPAGESDEGATLMRMTPMLVQPDGRFDFVNVPSGNYELRVQTVLTSARGGGPSGTAMTFLGRSGVPPPPSAPAPVEGLLWAVTPLVVGDRDVTGISVPLRPGGFASGTVRFPANTPLPPQVQGRATVALLLLNPPAGLQVPAYATAMNPDATFKITWGVPGRYRILFNVPVPSLTLKTVEVGGVDMTDMPVEIRADLSDVVLTLSDLPPATINGTVQRTGPPEDLTALIFTADRRLWADPEAAFRRYRAAPVARNGTFTGTFPSGDYFIAVVPDAQSADWQEPAKLETLSRTATRITLLDGQKQPVEVRR